MRKSLISRRDANRIRNFSSSNKSIFFLRAFRYYLPHARVPSFARAHQCESGAYMWAHHGTPREREREEGNAISPRTMIRRLCFLSTPTRSYASGLYTVSRDARNDFSNISIIKEFLVEEHVGKVKYVRNFSTISRS